MMTVRGIITYPGAKRPAPVAKILPPGIMGDVLRALIEAADSGRPCPSGEDLARRFDLSGPKAALTVIGKLEDSGWISVDRTSRRRLVVTITDSGKSTAGPPPRPEPPKGKALADNDAMILALLEWAARTGAPCPSNNQMAAQLRWPAANTVSKMVTRLERQGIITVERFNSARVVTIVSTGQHTARPACTKPHWRHAKRGEQ